MRSINLAMKCLCHMINPTFSCIAAYGYGTSWVCNNGNDAFVDGGMYFNVLEQKLFVPRCGYYYISSSIFYQSDSSITNDDPKYVRHEVNIQRNCGSSRDDRLTLRSYSSFDATPQNFGRTSTFVGSVVKMCTDGSISVLIPRNQPCCPIGRDQSTYLSAFLVEESSCEPPEISTSPPN